MKCANCKTTMQKGKIGTPAEIDSAWYSEDEEEALGLTAWRCKKCNLVTFTTFIDEDL